MSDFNTSKVQAYLSAATSIASALATEAETIASGTGNTAIATHIASGLSAFQNLSGPVQDIEQMALNLFGFFGQLAAGHAAAKSAAAQG